ncbi:MAG TPA: hypothetical protein VFN44_22755 [Solirubrobacteraceae bacterium]|nr:hypothetical protein [Solirubrobacteraceae bacterium]
MKPLENVWNGLVQRRLLPVAILLLAALVAVPFLLAKDPEPVAPSPGAATGDKTLTADAATADPVVSLVDDSTPKERRRVLGARKNPFQPAPAPKAEKSDTTETTAQTPAPTGGAEADKPAGSGTAPASPQTPVTAPGVPAEPKPTYELYSLTVRFGDAESSTLEKLNLPRLKPLPSAEEPVLVYLGPGQGGKSAIFMVDEGVIAQGDATCKPSPRNCETLHMRPGDTEFLDVTDEDGTVTAQYQLDLLKIKTSKTADASAAAAARAKVSKGGEQALKVRQASMGPLRYRYDSRSGTVRKIGKRAYKALLAKSARIALGTAGGF